MAEHISTFDEDDDGWPLVSCSCGWVTSGLPDMEIAADVWGDHRAVNAVYDILFNLFTVYDFMRQETDDGSRWNRLRDEVVDEVKRLRTLYG